MTTPTSGRVDVGVEYYERANGSRRVLDEVSCTLDEHVVLPIDAELPGQRVRLDAYLELLGRTYEATTFNVSKENYRRLTGTEWSRI
jgi:hypothetical protein